MSLNKILLRFKKNAPPAEKSLALAIDKLDNQVLHDTSGENTSDLFDASILFIPLGEMQLPQTKLFSLSDKDSQSPLEQEGIIESPWEERSFTLLDALNLQFRRYELELALEKLKKEEAELKPKGDATLKELRVNKVNQAQLKHEIDITRLALTGESHYLSAQKEAFSWELKREIARDDNPKTKEITLRAALLAQRASEEDDIPKITKPTFLGRFKLWRANITERWQRWRHGKGYYQHKLQDAYKLLQSVNARVKDAIPEDKKPLYNDLVVGVNERFKTAVDKEPIQPQDLSSRDLLGGTSDKKIAARLGIKPPKNWTSLSTKEKRAHFFKESASDRSPSEERASQEKAKHPLAEFSIGLTLSQTSSQTSSQTQSTTTTQETTTTTTATLLTEEEKKPLVTEKWRSGLTIKLGAVRQKHNFESHKVEVVQQPFAVRDEFYGEIDFSADAISNNLLRGLLTTAWLDKTTQNTAIYLHRVSFPLTNQDNAFTDENVSLLILSQNETLTEDEINQHPAVTTLKDKKWIDDTPPQIKSESLDNILAGFKDPAALKDTELDTIKARFSLGEAEKNIILTTLALSLESDKIALSQKTTQTLSQSLTTEAGDINQSVWSVLSSVVSPLLPGNAHQFGRQVSYNKEKSQIVLRVSPEITNVPVITLFHPDYLSASESKQKSILSAFGVQGVEKPYSLKAVATKIDEKNQNILKKHDLLKLTRYLESSAERRKQLYQQAGANIFGRPRKEPEKTKHLDAIKHKELHLRLASLLYRTEKEKPGSLTHIRANIKSLLQLLEHEDARSEITATLINQVIVPYAGDPLLLFESSAFSELLGHLESKHNELLFGWLSHAIAQTPENVYQTDFIGETKLFNDFFELAKNAEKKAKEQNSEFTLSKPELGFRHIDLTELQKLTHTLFATSGDLSAILFKHLDVVATLTDKEIKSFKQQGYRFFHNAQHLENKQLNDVIGVIPDLSKLEVSDLKKALDPKHHLSTEKDILRAIYFRTLGLNPYHREKSFEVLLRTFADETQHKSSAQILAWIKDFSHELSPSFESAFSSQKEDYPGVISSLLHIQLLQEASSDNAPTVLTIERFTELISEEHNDGPYSNDFERWIYSYPVEGGGEQQRENINPQRLVSLLNLYKHATSSDNKQSIARELKKFEGIYVKSLGNQSEIVKRNNSFQTLWRAYQEFSLSDITDWRTKADTIIESDVPEKDKQIQLLALIAAAETRTGQGHVPRREQLLTALLALEKGDQFFDVKTGEGKTLLFQLQFLTAALSGEKVDVHTHSRELAKEGAEAVEKLAKTFNLKVAYQGDELADADIVFATSTDLAIWHQQAAFFGDGPLVNKSDGTIRAQTTAYIDEVDTLIDVSASSTGQIAIELEEKDLSAFYNALNEAISTFESAETTREGKRLAIIQAIDKKLTQDPKAQNSEAYKYFQQVKSEAPLIDSWIGAAIAATNLENDIDYVLSKQKDGSFKVDIIQQASGERDSISVWGQGVHQLVAARESKRHDGVLIPTLTETVAEASVPLLIQGYQRVIGLSGTLGSREERARLVEIVGEKDSPPHFTDIPKGAAARRYDYQPLALEDEEEHYAALTDIVHRNQGNVGWSEQGEAIFKHREKREQKERFDKGQGKKEIKAFGAKRSTAIVFSSIASLNNFKKHLEQQPPPPIKFKIYDDTTPEALESSFQHHESIDKLKQETREPGTIILTTVVGGRGIDFSQLDQVIVADYLSERQEQQAFGRAGRAGLFGLAQEVVFGTRPQEEPLDLVALSRAKEKQQVTINDFQKAFLAFSKENTFDKTGADYKEYLRTYTEHFNRFKRALETDKTSEPSALLSDALGALKVTFQNGHKDLNFTALDSEPAPTTIHRLS